MSTKKILLIIIVSISIGVGAYLFVQKDTEKKFPSLSPGLSLLPDQPEAERNSSFYLQTEKKNYQKGESFDLTVMINAKKEIVDGVEFVLNYDPEIVEIGEPVPGTFFSLYPQKKVDPEKGRVKAIALQSLDEDKSLDKEIMVVLPVIALQKGIVNFEFDREKTHISAYGGQDLLQQTKGLNIIIF